MSGSPLASDRVGQSLEDTESSVRHQDGCLKDEDRNA